MGHHCRCRIPQVGSTLVCKLYPARYGRSEDVMIASLSSRTQQVLAVDILEVDTELVTPMEGAGLGLRYNTSTSVSM